MLPILSAEHIPNAPALLVCWGLRHVMAVSVWNSEGKIEVYSARGTLGMGVGSRWIVSVQELG